MSRADSDTTLTLNNVSCFVIDRGIRGCAGTMKSIFRQKDGSLLIETNTKTQAAKLMKLTELYGPVKVKVVEHPTLNLCKGIVSCYDFTFSTNEEMQKELASQGVVNVNIFRKRVKTYDNQTKFINTSYAVLTFKLCCIPERINIGFYTSKVKQYIPNPMRCYKCQKFGHSLNYCTNQKLCGKCGKEDHNSSETCTNPEQCANCYQAHPSWSRNCEIFKEEFDVQKLKVTNKITYRAARREYIKLNPTARINNQRHKPSYAYVTNNMTNKEGQTQSEHANVNKQLSNENHNNKKSNVNNDVSTDTNMEYEPIATNENHNNEQLKNVNNDVSKDTNMEYEPIETNERNTNQEEEGSIQESSGSDFLGFTDSPVDEPRIVWHEDL